MPTDLRDALDRAAPRHVPDLEFDRLWRRHRRSRLRNRALAVTGTVLAVLTAASLWPAGPSIRIDPVAEEPVIDQESDPGRTQAILGMLDAIDARDTEAFIGAFAPSGAFDPRGDFASSSSLFAGTLPVTEEDLVEAWMAIIDAWGLEAQMRNCDREDLDGGHYVGGEVVTCEVTTRWHTLSMELTEEWQFEFVGDELMFWGYRLVDLDPVERTLPLGFSDLERWETWLQDNRPYDAARYLNPREFRANCSGCVEWRADLAPGDPARARRLAPLMWSAERDWSINGRRFSPAGLIPYDPAFADEIETAIQEYYMESRSGAPPEEAPR